MAAEDINGKRINNWDRVTRNGVIVMFCGVYCFMFIAPYFGLETRKENDPTMLKGLDTLVTAIVFFLIGRNTQPAKE